LDSRTKDEQPKATFTAEQGVSSNFTGPSFDATDPSFTNGQLIDGNLNASAGINLDVQSSNIAIRFDTGQTVNKINLNIATSLTKAVIDTLNFGWQLFTSDDGIIWTFRGVQLPVYEEIPSQRFVFSFVETSARFLRLVNTLAPNTGSAIEVTEMEGVGFLLAIPKQSFSSTQTRTFGGYGITFTPTEALRISYNISFSHSEDDVAGTDRGSTNITQGVNLGYTVIPRYLILVTSFAMTSTIPEGGDTTRFDSYNLTLTSNPLPTVGGLLGFRLTEASTGGDTTSRTDSLTANLSLDIYRDVALSLTSNFSESRDLVGDSKSQTFAFSGNLRLKPWKPLFILLSGSTFRSVTEREGEESTSTGESLSSIFSLSLTRRVFISGSFPIIPDFSNSYSVSWLPTDNIQAIITAGFSGDSTNFGVNLNWRPLPRVSLNFGYSGTRNDATDDKTDSFFARGSVSF
jgi:hypothetical protein